MKWSETAQKLAIYGRKPEEERPELEVWNKKAYFLWLKLNGLRSGVLKINDIITLAAYEAYDEEEEEELIDKIILLERWYQEEIRHEANTNKNR